MITEAKKVICESIPPFSTARMNCNLDECDYEEEEYYIYGTSRLYARDRETNKAKILMEQAPYVNRFIVRAPKNPQKTSGNVVVELLNPSSGMEIERMWINAYRKFMRDGDIYVGLTIKPNTLKCLKVYSEERYGCLQWPNPRAEIAFPFSKTEADAYIFGMHISHDFETGLCWDMITDLAHLLRSDRSDNPLRAYGNLTLILTGWSQDVSYIRTYVNYFANEMEENIYDGYLCAGGVPALFMALNQYELLDDVDSKLGRVHHCRVPFMVVQTESDASAWDAVYGKKADSDEPGFPYRLYEIAGGSHDTENNLIRYYQNDPELQRAAATIELPPVYNGHHEHANDYPYEFIWNACYRNLFYWIHTGVAPRSMERIRVDEVGRALRDGFGNSVGGIRTCFVNYPTAHYSSGDGIHRSGEPYTRNSQTELSAFGYEEPFSAELLKTLYGSLENYRKLCEEDTARQVSRGFVCREDAEELVNLAVKTAARRGLQ